MTNGVYSGPNGHLTSWHDLRMIAVALIYAADLLGIASVFAAARSIRR